MAYKCGKIAEAFASGTRTDLDALDTASHVVLGLLHLKIDMAKVALYVCDTKTGKVQRMADDFDRAAFNRILFPSQYDSMYCSNDKFYINPSYLQVRWCANRVAMAGHLSHRVVCRCCPQFLDATFDPDFLMTTLYQAKDYRWVVVMCPRAAVERARVEFQVDPSVFPKALMERLHVASPSKFRDAFDFGASPKRSCYMAFFDGLDTRCTCAMCGADLPLRELRTCSGGCQGKAMYCSTSCQRVHWPHHRAACAGSGFFSTCPPLNDVVVRVSAATLLFLADDVAWNVQLPQPTAVQ